MKYYYVVAEWSASDIERFIVYTDNPDKIRERYKGYRYVTIKEINCVTF